MEQEGKGHGSKSQQRAEEKSHLESASQQCECPASPTLSMVPSCTNIALQISMLAC